jgi:hypothetical protein
MSRHHHAHNASRAGMKRPAASPPRPQPRPGWPAGAVRLRTRTAAKAHPRHATRADPCGVKAASGGHSSSGHSPSPSPQAALHHARRAWSGASAANAGVFVGLRRRSQQSADPRSSPVIVSRWPLHSTACSLSALSVVFPIPKTLVARANPRFAWVALSPGAAALCRGGTAHASLRSPWKILAP